MATTSRTSHGEALLHELRELGAIRRDLQRRAALGGVAGGLVALSAIDRLGRARVSQVADELQVDLSVASRQVAGLHAVGYVNRVADPSDGRSQNVKLTSAGRRALRKAQTRSMEVLDRITEGWSDDEVEGLVSGLRRLREDYAQLSLGGGLTDEEDT